MLLADRSYSIHERPCDILDVAPTILEIAGVEQPEYMSGQAVFRQAE
jgi:bisphosphoglycerate-independent phosphoglycerate mutase (AlkP superfamily)